MKQAILLILIVILGVMACVVIGWDEHQAELTYNHGICLKCGGHYRLATTLGRSGRVAVYECDTCFHTFQAPRIFY